MCRPPAVFWCIVFFAAAIQLSGEQMSVVCGHNKVIFSYQTRNTEVFGVCVCSPDFGVFFWIELEVCVCYRVQGGLLSCRNYRCVVVVWLLSLMNYPRGSGEGIVVAIAPRPHL